MCGPTSLTEHQNFNHPLHVPIWIFTEVQGTFDFALDSLQASGHMVGNTTAADGDAISYSFSVSKPGNYVVEFLTLKRAGLAVVDVYLDLVKVGSIDCTVSPDEDNVRKTCTSCGLAAGTHTLKFVANGSTSDPPSYTFYLSDIYIVEG